MNVTQLINNLSSGTAAASGLGASKHTLTADGLVLTLRATNPAGGAEPRKPVVLNYFTSPVDMTTAQAMAMKKDASKLVVRLSDKASGVAEESSEISYAAGEYLYSWIDQWDLDAAVTYNAYVNEI